MENMETYSILAGAWLLFVVIVWADLFFNIVFYSLAFIGIILSFRILLGF